MSLFKRLWRNSQEWSDKNSVTFSSGMQKMSENLQKKFSKGVQYNMKIVIRGDVNVGKTSLFHRLQGHAFSEAYSPTAEIQVSSIHWNYRATDDVVKVELWDVVDVGRKRKDATGLKIANDCGTTNTEPFLDAEFLDVYKGTHGVILVYDITKHWTFGYVERELPKVPARVSVLVLGSHLDMGHHRTVTPETAIGLVESCQSGRIEGEGHIRYAEASMRNGFGLRYLYLFLNLPFLHLQRETLLSQLEVNTHDLRLTTEELSLHEESAEQNYNVFQESLAAGRRHQQDRSPTEEFAVCTRHHQGRSGSVVASDDSSLFSENAPQGSNDDASRNVPNKKVPCPPSQPALWNDAGGQSAGRYGSQSLVDAHAGIDQSVTSDLQGKVPLTEKRPGILARLFGAKQQEVRTEGGWRMEDGAEVDNVDDFAPDIAAIDGFLNDVAVIARDDGDRDDGDSDDEAGVNPLVATFQDFLESDSDATDPVSAISPMSTTSLTPPARGAKYVGVLEKNRNNGEGVSFAEHAPIQSTNVSNDPESSDQSGSRKIGPAFHTMGSSSSGEEAGTLVPVKNEALPGRCSTLNGAVRKTGRGSEKRLGECGDDGSPVDFRLSRSTVVERVGRSSGADADRMDPAPGHHESIPSDDTSLPPSSRRHSAIHYRGVAVDEFSAWLDTMDKVAPVDDGVVGMSDEQHQISASSPYSGSKVKQQHTGCVALLVGTDTVSGSGMTEPSGQPGLKSEEESRGKPKKMKKREKNDKLKDRQKTRQKCKGDDPADGCHARTVGLGLGAFSGCVGGQQEETYESL